MVLAALSLVLWPSRCGLCGVSLDTRPASRLCDGCFESLTVNDGPRCPCCDAPRAHPSVVHVPCERCAQQTPAFAALRAPFLYGGRLAELVVASKFHQRDDLAYAQAALLETCPQVRAWLAQADALVPVPLGTRRRRVRGYNQSACIARGLARRWHLPVVRALYRTRQTQPQSSLTLAERRHNVREAFASRRPVAGTVLLVDDVVTSAETVRQAAAALRGATRIFVIATARASENFAETEPDVKHA